MSFESAAELATNTAALGDAAVVGPFTLYGAFSVPQAEEMLVEGTAPTFTALRNELAVASVSVGSTIDSVRTFTGASYGPYRVVRWQSVLDGVYVTLGLEQR